MINVSCLDVEEQECEVNFCLPKCPKYEMKHLQTQKDDPTKLTATFIISKAEYPIGILKHQSITLKPHNTLFQTHSEKLQLDDFDDITNSANVTIENLILNQSYTPEYEFIFDFASNDGHLNDPIELSWKCQGKVSNTNSLKYDPS